MGNDYHCHVVMSQLFHYFQNFPYHFRVEGRSRFVEQHHFWFHTQGTHNGDTLFLAAGKLRRVRIRSVFQTNTSQQLHCLFRRFRFALFQQLHGGNGHIFQYCHMGEEIEMLEHHTHFLTMDIDVRFIISDICVFEEDTAASGHFQQIQAAQERRLTGTGGADNNDYFAFFDLCIDTVQSFDLAAIIIFLQTFYFDQCFISVHCFSTSFQGYLPDM